MSFTCTTGASCEPGSHIRPTGAPTEGQSGRTFLRDQLDVSEGEFWACAQDKVKPDRGEPRVPAEALPAELVHLLMTQIGLSDAEIAGISRADAIARMQEHWSRPPGG
jgi:hypothetical protein